MAFQGRRESPPPKLARRNHEPRSPKRSKFDSADTKLVQNFYRLWSDSPEHQPSYHEKQQAHAINKQYGSDAAAKLLPTIVKLMKERFPDAMSFGATKNFWAVANQQAKKRQTQQSQQQQNRIQQTRDDERREQERQRKQKLRSEWNHLDESERQSIRRNVLQTCDGFVRRKIEERDYDHGLVMLACLNRLDECRNGDRAVAL